MISFKLIEEEDENNFFASGIASRIEKDIAGKIGFYQFLSKTLELYLIHFKDTLVHMSGSEEETPEEKVG
ncbi:MAG: hypothetical protein HC912_04035 [Saprospiraceae bacterium]|nr:hypothetical protein [Saprospiraceae bacterium]